ncbi:uncharacterized protein LOC115621334 [Scaptodrosophila lebanonensis]|uniref:Uncharacterized protein LOC115621334 n=1 Tax=Drosophila lebanonensis TaxID=7225 RepID=A0A6J2T6C0_DROLE|nr:uncharacterized protein LOC115621334 [Scaptodrosophila lebanonensis]
MGHWYREAGLSLLLLALVNGQCHFTLDETKSSKFGFLTYREAAGADHMQRQGVVPNGATIYMNCHDPKKPKTGVVKDVVCNNNQFQKPLPLCEHMKSSEVREVNDNSCPATMFATGVEIRGQFVELFRSCYDKSNLRALFSKNIVYKNTFFGPNPNLSFDCGKVVPTRDMEAYKKEKVYDTFFNIYGSNRYIADAKTIAISRGHLSCATEYLYRNLKCASFKYVNVVPQFQSINGGNWKNIEKWVNSQVPVNSYLRIETGGIGVLKLPDVEGNLKPAFLLGGNQIPVPEWTYKLIKDARNQPIHAILTSNNKYGEKIPAPAFCTQIRCPGFDYTDASDQGYTYCCDARTFNPPRELIPPTVSKTPSRPNSRTRPGGAH